MTLLIVGVAAWMARARRKQPKAQARTKIFFLFMAQVKRFDEL
jgi:cbb3-type cytochrome oxidase subunit 3